MAYGRHQTHAVYFDCSNWPCGVLKKSLHLGFVWLMALCVFAQGIGAAAGGVLCFGCANVWGGVAVVKQACETTDTCCANRADHSNKAAPCDDEGDGHSPSQHCGCVDVTLAPHAAVATKPSFKLILPLVQHAIVALPIMLAQQSPVLNPQGTARAGPVLQVRSLNPAERQTVLIL